MLIAQRKAYEGYRLVLTAQSNREPAATGMELLTHPLVFHPAYQPALETLIDYAKRAGRTVEAESYQRTLQPWTQPHTPLDIRFPSGIELAGLDSPPTVQRGARFTRTIPE